MRDPDRINEILELISKIWHKNPDLRLCQLIGNCFLVFSGPNVILPSPNDPYPDSDLYHVEDDKLQDRLIDKYL